MDFGLNEEQKQIQALGVQFCEREVDPKRMKQLMENVTKAKTADEVRDNYPWDLVEKLRDLGLHQLAVPKQYGGTAPESEGNITRAALCEALGYAGGGIVASMLASQYLECGVAATNRCHTEEQREWVFSRFMEDHKCHLGTTISEPEGASDVHLPYDAPGEAIRTFAYKDGDEWVINGDKMFSSDACVSGLLQVAARTDKEKPITQSLSFFWVPRGTPGLTISVNKLAAADLSGNGQAHYDNVRVPESNLRGQANSGFDILHDIANNKWIILLGRLGSTQRLFETFRNYAKERVQGGRPIIQHSHVAAMLGEMAISLEAARGLLYRTAWENDKCEQAGKPAKLYWTEGCFHYFKKLSLRLIEVGFEIYGGIGGSVDLPLEEFARQTLAHLSGGTTAMMQKIKCCIEYEDR